MNDKTLAALAYITWVPSLYIVLARKKKDEFSCFHGNQALLLWVLIFLAFFTLRYLVNLVWSFIYIPYLDLLEVFFGFGAWGYAVYCGTRCFRGEAFTIPH